MPETGITKQQLRQTLRGRRRALDAEARADASQRLCRHFQAIPGWDQFRHVAGYVAADGELDPAPLLLHLHAAVKRLYLPVITADNHLVFARWTPGDELLFNRYGIPEPLPDCPRHDAGVLEAALLPLVGWSRWGQRLGMGGGFYDRSLAGNSRVVKIGVGYAMQESAAIPCEPWDVRLDYVVTETALHSCRETIQQ